MLRKNANKAKNPKTKQTKNQPHIHKKKKIIKPKQTNKKRNHQKKKNPNKKPQTQTPLMGKKNQKTYFSRKLLFGIER